MVAFFDLDRTLIDCNSGRLWVQAEWSAGRLGLFEVAWASWWMVRYTLGRDVGMEEAFERAVATLEDSDEREFAERTERWFDERVRARLRPGAGQTIERHRQAGERMVVATSGTVYAARAAQRAFGLDDAIGTVPEVVDGVFTGRIEGMGYGAAKRVLVEAWAEREGVDLADSVFYTDSISDLPLLLAVGEPVIVNPDAALAREARERGWQVVDWGVS